MVRSRLLLYIWRNDHERVPHFTQKSGPSATKGLPNWLMFDETAYMYKGEINIRLHL